MFGDKYDIERIIKGLVEEIKNGNRSYEETIKELPEEFKETFERLYNESTN